ncbi:guanosine-3',5'-bis(diphosphate) 3'-pyrophosphohydrolase, partial [Variovorax sp. 2RAF20]
VGERSVVPPLQGKSRAGLANDLVAEPIEGTLPAAPAGELFIDAVLAQSYRHFFGPTSQPAVPPRQQVISISRLMETLTYLKPADQA